MLRVVPAFLGCGLAVLWLLGLLDDATVWLTWTVALASLGAFATVGLIPERAGGLWAATCLMLLSAALAGMWFVGWKSGATAWLAWWSFVFACLCAAAATAAAVQDVIDRRRAG